jgi:hypothetical protein
MTWVLKFILSGKGSLPALVHWFSLVVEFTGLGVFLDLV